MTRKSQTALLPLLITLLVSATLVTRTNTESQPTSSSSAAASISRHVSLGSVSYSRQLYTVYMKALPPVISYHGGVDGLQATATAAATEEEEEEEEVEEAEEEEESVRLGNERSKRGEAGDYDYRDYYGDYRDSDSSDGGNERRDGYKEGGDRSVRDAIKDRKGGSVRGERGGEGISAMQIDERRLQDEQEALFEEEPGLQEEPVAAGNAGVKVNYATLGSLSGVAPRARIAVYKVIWGGMSSLADVMAAVEDAVKDGVDVLSLAVGGTDDNYFNSIFLLRAVQAGVLVVAPAGNNGPPPTPTYWRTLTNVAPYILTVGASATDREWSATLTLGNGTALFGVTQTGGDGVLTANLPLIDSEEAHAKGAALWEARQCRPGKIDAEKVGGGLVLCYIGGISPEKKARTVQDAGARGMVLIPRNSNESVRSVSGNFPVISFGYPKGVLIRDYIMKTASPTATLSHLVLEQPRKVRAPIMAYFSSSGPPYRPGWPYRALPTITNDVLKPDLVAPGLTILAAAAYGNSPGFSMQSGTSVSAACVAGIAAMVMQKHPDWTPAAVKSALMTTARVKDASQLVVQPMLGIDS
ncbi:unnamed protein product [Closterium sp. NIES-65]|nr:unnamed protein product [Closterium sp. NIES-65]